MIVTGGGYDTSTDNSVKVNPQKEGTTKKKSTSVFTENKTKTVQKTTVNTSTSGGCDFWGKLGSGLGNLFCGVGNLLSGTLNLGGKVLQAGGGILGSLGMALPNFSFGMGMPMMGMGFGMPMTLGAVLPPIGFPFGNGGLGCFPGMMGGFGGCCRPGGFPTYVARGIAPGYGHISGGCGGIGSGCASLNPLGHYNGHWGKSNVFGFDTKAFGMC